MPIYNLAMRAVGQLKAADITELKGFPKAPPAAVIVVRALVLLYEKPILKKADPDGGSKKVDDWWESGKKGVLGMKDLLGRCKEFKKDDIPPEVIAAVKPIVELPEFNDEVLKKASTAAAGLGKWVRAMVQYDEAMKIVKPKQAQLAGAKEASAAAQALWDAALEKLRAVEAQMKELVDRLDAAEAKKKQLQDEFETAERKLLRANQLISKLKDEEVNWAKSLVQNRAFKECLVGDIIISSGIIAYLGVFT
jgi:dynein heavy chain